ncbi:hypothetical protein OG455_11750 [Kitasatospora sp. NBC_01287]|uniref:hypothetical protein n=1 Tax=Kitasatospora sp. NBC_01287 TaxID=2903573 RepID=UPI0022518B32|nr:hypothetical protein [Kitasatospora sp. NBC_01287]MCX4746189.1 hypothetical protein [Kitasatospora sp. NBC_01287]
MKRSEPPRHPYTPQVGELVHDTKHDVDGVYQSPGFGKYPTVYLRPVGGGIEWETPASEIDRIHPARELDPVQPTGAQDRARKQATA